MATRMQQRRGTAAQWATANPVLADGEVGYETDTRIIKIGDGVTSWTALRSGYLSLRGGDTITPSGVGVVALTIALLSGQTSAAFELKNHLNEVLARLGPNGEFNAKGRITQNGNPVTTLTTHFLFGIQP